MRESVIFCDFDGTITKEDTIDKLLEKHASDEWLEIEKLWEEGIIGSKECLEKQIKCINYLSEKKFKDFIDSIEIDEHFADFIERVKSRKIDFYIVSDGFDLIIDSILTRYNINNVEKFCNTLYLKYGELETDFPFKRENCKSGAGVCKCNIIKENSQGKTIIYIGDGRSDMCAAKNADVLFAKGKLADYCENNKINHIRFTDFRDIIEYLKMEDKTLVKNRFVFR